MVKAVYRCSRGMSHCFPLPFHRFHAHNQRVKSFFYRPVGAKDIMVIINWHQKFSRSVCFHGFRTLTAVLRLSHCQTEPG